MGRKLVNPVEEPATNSPNTQRPPGDWQTVDDPISHLDEPERQQEDPDFEQEPEDEIA